MNELKKQQATKKFSELRETFTNTVYEQADSLKPVVDKLADKTKLKIETAAGVIRTADPALAPTVAYNNQKFLTAMFADDSLKNKHNTEALEVSPGTLISGRVTEYKAASQKSFDDVQAVVREAVVQAEARNLAQKAEEAKLAELKAKDDLTGFGEVQTIARTKPSGVNSCHDANLDEGRCQQVTGVCRGRSTRRWVTAWFGSTRSNQPAAPDAAHVAAIQQQLGNALAQQEMLSYIDALKQKAKVKILRPDAVNPPAWKRHRRRRLEVELE